MIAGEVEEHATTVVDVLVRTLASREVDKKLQSLQTVAADVGTTRASVESVKGDVKELKGKVNARDAAISELHKG